MNGNTIVRSVAALCLVGIVATETPALAAPGALLELSSPTQGQTITGYTGIGATLNVTGTSSGPAGGIQAIDVSVNKAGYVPATPRAPGDFSSFSLSQVLMASGKVPVLVRSTDSNGARSFRWTSVMVALVQDTTPPALTVAAAPAVSGPYAGVPITISGTAQDAETGLKLVEVQVGSGPFATSQISDGARWTFSTIVTTGLVPPPSGTIALTVRATDRSDNQVTQTLSVGVSFVDTVAPQVSITLPATGASLSGPHTGAKVTVTGGASDQETGVKLVEVQLAGGAFEAATPIAPGNWSSWTLDGTIGSSGPADVVARATDNAGNQQTATVSVSVSLAPPPLAVAIFPVTDYAPLTALLNSRFNSSDWVANFRESQLARWPNQRHALLTYSVTNGNAQSVIDTAIAHPTTLKPGLDAIMYDEEAGNGNLSTPPAEIATPVPYTAQCADMVHAAGFKSGTTPTHTNLSAIYKQVDWTKQDFLVMQVQKMTDTAANQAALVSLVKTVSQFVRGQNPKITIFAQFNPVFQDSSVVVSLVGQIRGSIDGIALVIPGGLSATSTPTVDQFTSSVQTILDGIGR